MASEMLQAARQVLACLCLCKKQLICKTRMRFCWGWRRFSPSARNSKGFSVAGGQYCQAKACDFSALGKVIPLLLHFLIFVTGRIYFQSMNMVGKYFDNNQWWTEFTTGRNAEVARGSGLAEEWSLEHWCLSSLHNCFDHKWLIAWDLSSKSIAFLSRN